MQHAKIVALIKYQRPWGPWTKTNRRSRVTLFNTRAAGVDI